MATKTDILELSNILHKSQFVGCAWGFSEKNRLSELIPESQILVEFEDLAKVA